MPNNHYPKPLQILAENTFGESYATRKYCLDNSDLPNNSISIEKNFSFENYGETTRYLEPISVLEIQTKLTEPIFSYFLDGSRRTYKIDDIRYNERIYPVLIGQIGVSCCYRESPIKFKNLRTNNRLVLAVPSSANPDTLDFNNLRNKINSESSLQRFGFKIHKIITYPEKEGFEYSNLAIAALHEEMLDMEKEFVDWLVQEKRVLTPYNRLIKDGSIEYQKSNRGTYRDVSRLKSNYKCVVGVSKKFDPEKCVDRFGKSNASLIAQLPLYHRTPVFKFRSQRAGGDGGPVYIAAWYIRIRDLKHTISPFDGVIKAEKILTDSREIEEGLDSEEVDLISANLVWERNPTCYGKDSRWANHLYPIHLTELSMKSRRLSDQVLMNIF